jgi:1-acyl-sn-glycerol-3-phosphate acyltransferase
VKPSVEAARGGARALAMSAITLSMLGGVTLHQRLAAEPQRNAVFQRWMKHWAQRLLDVFGFEVLLVSPPPPTAAGARLVVSNHRSPIDILILLRQFGGVVLSRGDLARWPVLGPAARAAETIFVDRADALSGFIAIRHIRERLEQGRTVIVFPEGTTHRGDEVHELQGGAFAAARGLAVELVPVGIAYEPGAEFFQETFVQHMQRVASRPRTRVAVAFGAARPLSGSRKELCAALQGEVQALVHEARAALEQRG